MLTRLPQHSVDHESKLRFALTCRYIDPKSLKEPLGYEVKPDYGVYNGPAWTEQDVSSNVE
jgi:hypothetical protein